MSLAGFGIYEAPYYSNEFIFSSLSLYKIGFIFPLNVKNLPNVKN